MSKIIGLAGKGGTGKTTVASLIVDWLVKEKKTPVLAIDADPNSTLAESLGLAQTKGIVQIVDEFSGGRQNIPAGQSKQDFFEYKIHELVNEAEDFDLLSMGRPEGPGCYCYVNSLLKGLIEKLTKSYSYTVMDNEAGMEHLSRRTARSIDTLFIISDSSQIGIKSAKRIYDLAREMGVNIVHTYMIINRARGSGEDIRDEVKKTGIELAGIVPEDNELYELSLKGRPVTELSEDSPAKKAINEICQAVIARSP